jgi:anti-sigma factor (TIGR02949 family)
LDVKMDCQTFQRWIYHYQAEEIPEAERQDFEDHLDACPACARRLEIEERFLGALTRRLPREPAPPGLATRVRAALRAEAPDPSRIPWYRTSWFAATAAALLLVVILIPSLSSGPGFSGLAPVGEVIAISGEEVVVVDLDCDRAGMDLRYQRDCNHPDHVNALKTADGRYWHISPDQEAYGRLIHDLEVRGRKLVVDGQYYPAINTLHIDRSRPSARDIL